MSYTKNVADLSPLESIEIFTDVLPITETPVKPFIPIETPGDYTPDTFRGVAFTGSILDSDTGEPVEGATVYLYNGATATAGGATDSKGQFYITTDGGADTIQVSHAEYKGKQVKASIYENTGYFIIELTRDAKTLPPAETYPNDKKNNSLLWLLLGGGVLLSMKDKNKVGKVDGSTVALVVAGGTAILGIVLIKKTLEELGIFKTKEEKDFDNQIKDPGSFWNPKFWQAGPNGTLILTDSFCNWLFDEIYNSFGIFNDDEGRIYAAFKKLKTQSQLSYFSYWVQNKKNMDLLDWLIGSKYGPVGDHLSVAEIAIITNFVNQLPKYNV